MKSLLPWAWSSASRLASGTTTPIASLTENRRPAALRASISARSEPGTTDVPTGKGVYMACDIRPTLPAKGAGGHLPGRRGVLTRGWGPGQRRMERRRLAGVPPAGRRRSIRS